MDNTKKILMREQILKEALDHLKITGQLPKWLNIDNNRYTKSTNSVLPKVVTEYEESYGRKKATRRAAERLYSERACEDRLISASGHKSEAP